MYIRSIYALYMATYKNDVCGIHNFSAKCMYIYNIYVKYIQDMFSLIFQHGYRKTHFMKNVRILQDVTI